MFDDVLWLILALILIVPIACVVAFGLWMRHQSIPSGDVAAKYWDVFIKLISAFTVIIGGAMLMGQYMQQQREISVLEQARTDRELALRQAEFLRQKIVFENANHERKKAYLGEAKVLVARLAAQSNDPQSRQRFDELYYADLIGVEKTRGPVEQAMVAFSDLLLSEASAQDLRDQSLVLSRAVETELKDSEDNILEQWRKVSNLITR